jgi:hypothetical protein
VFEPVIGVVVGIRRGAGGDGVWIDAGGKRGCVIVVKRIIAVIVNQS